MLYTCTESNFNDAKNEQELIEYAREVLKNKVVNQEANIDNLDKETEKIVDVNTANEALEKYANEHWYPVTNDNEIKTVIKNELELCAYEAFEQMLQANGLAGNLDEKVISDAEMVKFANTYDEELLEEYATWNGGNSSVVNFVDNYVRTNAIDMAEKIFSFDKYWDKLVENAIDNLVSVGVNQTTARDYCTLMHRENVQKAAESEGKAEEIADIISE